MVLSLAFQEDTKDSEGADVVQAAYSNLANFQMKCAQKDFKKSKRVLIAMRDLVDVLGRAKLRKLKKLWKRNLNDLTSIRKTSTNGDALAYAYFHYASGSGRTPKQVSELAKTARRCGEAMRGGGDSSDSSSSNHLWTKRDAER